MTWPNIRTPKTLVIAAAVSLTTGMNAHAQTAQDDQGPIIIGESVGKYNWWDLQWFRTELEFLGEFKQDKRKTRGQPTEIVRSNLLRATNNLSFQSYIGHKNLIDLNALIRLGYEDQTVTNNLTDPDTHDTPISDLYDVQATVLGASTTPFTLYSQRDETYISREFASSLRTVTTEHGVKLSLNYESLPTRIQYFHRDQTQSDPGGSLGYNSTQDTFSAQSLLKLTDHNRLDVSYSLDHVDENPGIGFDDLYDRHDLTVSDYLTFGSEYQHSLRSNLRLLDRSGRFEQNVLRLDENLYLEHSRTLDTRYNFLFERETNIGQEQQTFSGDASVRHRLFQSLVSSATGGARSFEIPGIFTSTEVFGSGTLDYTKKVPYGRFDASASAGANFQDNSDRGGIIVILDEFHMFNDPFPIVLTRRNIDPNSIVITDLAGIITYQVNIDYTLTSSASEVRIDRQVLGSIVNGQPVLISYTLLPEPGSKIDTVTQTYSVRYTFNEGLFDGLSLYAIHQIVDHSLSTEDPTLFVLNDVRDLRFGAEYRIGDWFFAAEHQQHDSTVSPYNRLRLEARYDRRISRDSTLSFEFVHESLDYQDISNTLDLDRLRAKWRRRLRAGLDLSIYAQYRDERDNIRGDTQGFDQSLEINWNIRQTRIFAGFHNAILDGEDSDRFSQTFTIGVTRSF